MFAREQIPWASLVYIFLRKCLCGLLPIVPFMTIVLCRHVCQKVAFWETRFRVKSYSTLSRLSFPSGLSEVQSSRGFPVCVPELRVNAEELKHWPCRCPLWLACASSPDAPTILHLHAVQDPLPTVVFTRCDIQLFNVLFYTPHLHTHTYRQFKGIILW